MIDLGALGGAHSIASAVNNGGQIAGYSLTAGGLPHAVLWRERTPAAMISALIASVTNFGFQQSVSLLRNALSSLTRGNTTAACNEMGAFVNQVRAQAGKVFRSPSLVSG
jgi:probable HAF family extracellular repeat protein